MYTNLHYDNPDVGHQAFDSQAAADMTAAAGFSSMADDGESSAAEQLRGWMVAELAVLICLFGWGF